MPTEKVYETTREALERVQTFDPTTLGRVDDLGRQMNFAEAVKPADAIIAVYRRIPMSALADFTDGQLSAILGKSMPITARSSRFSTSTPPPPTQ